MASLIEGKLYLSSSNSTSLHVSYLPFLHLSLHLLLPGAHPCQNQDDLALESAFSSFAALVLPEVFFW